VVYPLQPGYLSYRSYGQPPELPHPLRDRIGHGEDLVGLLVQEKMVVAEVRPAHVPVEVLGLEVECEDVGQNEVHRRGHVASGTLLQIGRSRQTRVLPLHQGLATLCGRRPRAGVSTRGYFHRLAPSRRRRFHLYSSPFSDDISRPSSPP